MPVHPDGFEAILRDAHFVVAIPERRGQVWYGLARGMGDAALAAWLVLSEDTVRGHVNALVHDLLDAYAEIPATRAAAAALYWVHRECCHLDRRITIK